MYSKDFFTSKTTWGALIMLIAPSLRMAGFEVDEQGLVDAASMIAGAVIFVWGQFTRKTEISTVAGVKVKS